jgi:hypothetical protein
MMKAVNAIPGMGNLMAKEERKDFMASDKNKLLVRIEFIDEKGEPNAISAGCYFDVKPNLKQRSREKRNGLFVNEELEGAFI